MIRRRISSVARVLLVLDLLRPDGDVDEPYRAEEDRVIELDRNVSFANDPDLRRRIYGHVDILLPVGYRQRFDADFLEPLLSNIVSGDKLASSLTFGQFVKAIASFLAPYIAMWVLPKRYRRWNSVGVSCFRSIW